MFKRNKKNVLLLVLIAASFSLSPFAKAADIESYTLEQGIPFIGGAGQTLGYGEFSTLFQKFITAVYIIAAVAAFIKIFLAGLKWYTSSGSAKAISQAREDIKNALMGLAFLFLAGTLLVFINPNLNKLSKVFNPNGGTQCVQGGNSTNEGGSVATGALALIDGYYAQPILADKLNILTNPGVAGAAATKIGINITTGCRKNDGSCDPNYCGTYPYNCSPCAIDNKPEGGCKPLVSSNVQCHFNGNCVDLVPTDGDYTTAIKKLNAAGLDVLNESLDKCSAVGTGKHLHVSIPGTFITVYANDPDCWYPAK
ncbi:MAG: hypothetical protein WAW33_01500 [Minisyncoccia bacterium]